MQILEYEYVCNALCCECVSNKWGPTDCIESYDSLLNRSNQCINVLYAYTHIRKNEMMIRKWVWKKYEFATNYAFVNVYFKLRSEFNMQKIQISIDLMQTRAPKRSSYTNEWMTHVHTPSITKSIQATKKTIFIYSAVWWVCLCVSCICCIDKIAI